MPTPQDLLARLKTIPYPGFSRDIVSFGLVRDIEVSSGGVIVAAPSTAKEEVVRDRRGRLPDPVGDPGRDRRDRDRP